MAFTLKRAQCWSVDIGKIYSILSHLDVPAGGFSEPGERIVAPGMGGCASVCGSGVTGGGLKFVGSGVALWTQFSWVVSAFPRVLAAHIAHSEYNVHIGTSHTLKASNTEVPVSSFYHLLNQ